MIEDTAIEKDFAQFEEQERVPSERERESWAVRDLDGADWALGKIASLEAKRKECEDFVNRKKEMYDRWLLERSAEIDRDILWFSGHLEAFMRKEYAKDPRKKSMKLPSGKIGLRKSQAKVIWPKRDVDGLPNPAYASLMQTARRFQAIQVKEDYDASTLRKLFAFQDTEKGVQMVSEDGTVLPGVEIMAETDQKFFWDTPKDEEVAPAVPALEGIEEL